MTYSEPVRTKPRRIPAFLAAGLLVIIVAGCSNGAADTGAGSGGNNTSAAHDQAVKFAECMRQNGVSGFPDPGASGAFTIDAIANGSSLDVSSPAFRQAMSACKTLEPPGFTGATRSPEQQKAALQFAQCVRDNGVSDFPDPAPDGPIIDTSRMPGAPSAHSIPGFQAALQKCGAIYGDAMGLKSP
jgi:hypothetical protein